MKRVRCEEHNLNGTILHTHKGKKELYAKVLWDTHNTGIIAIKKLNNEAPKTS